MKCSSVLPFDYGGHKQKDLTVLICRVENALEFDAAVKPIGMVQMMFAKQYLVRDGTAVRDQYCSWHPEG
jgi:hypothetical protein